MCVCVFHLGLGREGECMHVADVSLSVTVKQ